MPVATNPNKLESIVSMIRDAIPNTKFNGALETKLSVLNRPAIAAGFDSVDAFSLDSDVQFIVSSDDFELVMAGHAYVEPLEYIIDMSSKELSDIDLKDSNGSVIHLNYDTLAAYSVYLKILSDKFCEEVRQTGLFAVNEELLVNKQYVLYYDSMNQPTITLLNTIVSELNSFLTTDAEGATEMQKNLSQVIRSSILQTVKDLHCFLEATSI